MPSTTVSLVLHYLGSTRTFSFRHTASHALASEEEIKYLASLGGVDWLRHRLRRGVALRLSTCGRVSPRPCENSCCACALDALCTIVPHPHSITSFIPDVEKLQTCLKPAKPLLQLNTHNVGPVCPAPAVSAFTALQYRFGL